jgi:tRNA(Ile)-lysidine synthase
MASLLQQVQAELTRLGVAPHHRLLVAVSGGADSMALLSILHQLGRSVAAAHVNYGLRGSDSNADEALVKSYCAEQGIPLYAEQLVDFKGPNLQARAREARMAFFEQWKDHCDFLALAHHRQDAREGFFIHLFRGSSPQALTNPKPRDGWRIRPLLSIEKAELIQWNVEQGVPWREDESNQGSLYLRNKLRNNLFPLLDDLIPGWEQGLDRSLYHLARAEEYPRWKALIQQYEKAIGPLKLLPTSIFTEPEAFDAIWLWTSETVHFEPQELQKWIQAGRGKRLIKNGWTLEKGGTHHLLYRAEDCTWKVDSNPATLGEMPPWIRFFLPEQDLHTSVWLKSPPGVDRFQVRPWRPGDTFFPQGGKGRRLVSDYLTDLKLPRVVKEALLVLECKGAVAWVIGLRPDGNWVTESNAKNAYLGRLN